MRVGLPFSIAIHLGLVVAGLIVIPTLSKAEPTPMVILPVELLTIADSTNVAPVVEKPKEDAKQEETAPAAAPAPAAPAEAAPEILPDKLAPPPPKKPEPEVAPKPTPPKAEPKKENFKDSLDSILKTVKTSKSKAPPAAQQSAANLNTVQDAAARRGVGDQTKMTITVSEYIRDQMLRKGCWGDHDDMPDAGRLRATFRVKFGRDGHFLEEPKLLDKDPHNDMPMQVFVAAARSGLSKCNLLGFDVPSQYYEAQPAQPIDILFLP